MRAKLSISGKLTGTFSNKAALAVNLFLKKKPPQKTEASIINRQDFLFLFSTELNN